MRYTTAEELKAVLVENRGKAWPIRETCCQREGERRAMIHRLAGRVVLEMVDRPDPTQPNKLIGFSTFYAHGDERPADWDADAEAALNIEFG